jgi:putative pyruvate formate lyase activating enzyme
MMNEYAVVPSYLKLYARGVLEKRIKRLRALLSPCRLCPRKCGVNRLNDEYGGCRSGRFAAVASSGPHFGEEAPLVGLHGSGTIFFAGCNLHCVFCQNHTISQHAGKPVSAEELALYMIELQERGCHNINLVSPTHVIAQIVEALPIAIRNGFTLPLVYNSGGYDSVETLKLLAGIIDIYMPDAKYGDNAPGLRYSDAASYRDVSRAALQEMHAQAGDLFINTNGIARRGLLIRHLVLPEDGARSRDVLRFIAHKLSKNSYVNIMAQYHPCYHAYKYRELDHGISMKEYTALLTYARSLGLHRGF